MRSNRAGLGNLVMWLASGERKRAAWSMSLFEVTAGARRSGNKTRNAGVAAQAGKALAATTDDTWGGLDFLASDAFVAEEHVADREFVPKDDADSDTPGLEPWRLEGAERNIRLAKPLEALVARANKVGPGFEKEHVAYPARAQLIAHHRPDDPPINSTWVYDPGDGEPGDWRAGLHGPVRVRRWVDQFCAAAPNPRDTASSLNDPEETFALLLNATRSGGDNSGWLGAHFANAEAVLSAEAFGFAHPADDGFHDIARTKDATIMEGGLEAFRTKFGSRNGLIYSPLAMSPDQWPFPGKQVIPVLTEIQEDYTDVHGKLCGLAPGRKKLVTWIPIFDWGPPVREPQDPPPRNPDDPPPPKYPGLIKVPFEGEDPGPGLGGGPGGGYPASLSGDGFWEGRTLEDLQRDYPAAGAVPPPNFGERSAAVMGQLEGTSVQYRARPALPDGRLSLYPRGGNEADDLAGLMYGYTLREALEAPVVADDVASPNYLFSSARDHDLPNQRWPFALSNEAELTENPVGGISGRVPARGPGSVFTLPSNVPVDWQYAENKDRWTGTPNATLRAIMAGKNTAGVVVPGKGGIGLRNLAGALVSGWQWELDFTDSATEPNINFTRRDATGVNAGVGKFKVNGVEVGTGDITSSSNLTSGRVVKATGNKEINTPVDLALGYITIDSADDTAQLLAGAGKGIEIRSPDRIILDVNGVHELVVTPGKVTIPGDLDPISLIFTERASAPTVNAGHFGLWAKNDTPNVLRARDDAGSDFKVPLILNSHTLLDDALARCDGTTGRLQSSGARLDDNNNLTVPGRVLSTADDDGIGYGTGAGGTALQTTTKSTAISIDKVCGEIVTDSENLAAGTSVAFTVSNSTVAATDLVLVCLGEASGYSAQSYTVRVENVKAGQFDVVLSNVTGGDLAEQVVVNFAVIKGVTS